MATSLQCPCLLAFISYLSMWIKPNTYLSKPFKARYMEGDVCPGVVFWPACTRYLHMLSLSFCREKSDSWRQVGSVKTVKKSWIVTQCGHVTLNFVQMALKPAKVMLLPNMFQFTRFHGVAVMQGLTFWDHARIATLMIQHYICYLILRIIVVAMLAFQSSADAATPKTMRNLIITYGTQQNSGWWSWLQTLRPVFEPGVTGNYPAASAQRHVVMFPSYKIVTTKHKTTMKHEYNSANILNTLIVD